MEISTGHALQLGIALILGISMLVIAYTISEEKVLGVLIVMIPFQLIMSRYGSLNMVLTYLVCVALLFKGRIKYFPLLYTICFIFFAYFLSMSQALRATSKDHLLYLITIGSDIVLFYMVYNHFRQTGNYRFAFKSLAWMNVLVILYGLIQLTVGFEKFAFLGISEFSFATQLEEKQRLVGTFGAPGVNAEYFALQILFLGYWFMHESLSRVRMFLIVLMMSNFALLIATGSRGSFLTLMGGSILFLWMFRKELGTQALMRITVVGSGLLILTALVVINFTKFNVLFERLGGTELKGGVPETRQAAFEAAINRIPENIILGHGPRLKLIDEETRRIPNYIPLGSYPHNLYLFLLYTVGVVGLFSWLFFFATMFAYFWKSKRFKTDDPVLNGFPKLAMVILIVFLIDQLKIEFLRFKLNDAQHYLFTLWAILLAFSKVLVVKASENNLKELQKDESKKELKCVELRK